MLVGLAVAVWAWPAILSASLELLEVRDGLLVHFDASRGLATLEGQAPENGERIERWADQATEIQGDNSALGDRRGPYLLSSVPELNGRPALDFRNGEHLVSELSIEIRQGNWFVVFRSAFTEEDGLVVFSEHAGSEIHPDDGGSLVARGWRVTGGSFPIDATITNLRSRSAEFFILNASRTSNGVIGQRLIDRTGRVLTARATGANENRTQNGVLIGGTGIGSSNRINGALTGQIAEVLVYDRPLTNAERSTVEAYLFQKYFGPPDSDQDDLPDEWEQNLFMTLDQNGEGDPDGDLLINRREFEAGTDPTRRDTDGDGLDDAREIALGSSPLEPDTDRDTFSDAIEAMAGTSPTSGASAPASLFTDLRIFSDMESAEPDRYRIRNLAGPGSAVWTRNVPDLQVAGIVGKGLRLSGIPEGGGLNYGLRAGFEATGGTVSLAFRLDSTTGRQLLACRGNRDATRPGWSIFTEDAGLAIRVTGSDRRTAVRLRHPGPLLPDTWYMVAVTFAPDGTITPYLDGASTSWDPGSERISDYGLNDGSPLLLGTDDNEADPLAGILDEFAVWTRALTPAEIGSLHQNARSGLGLDGQIRNATPIFHPAPQTEFVYRGQSFAVRSAVAAGVMQWRKNGGPLPGENSGEFIVENSMADDLGRFQALALNPGGLQPSPESLVRVESFDLQQVIKTLGDATASGEFVAEQLAVEDDTLVVGIPSYRTGLGAPRGVVRILRRNQANPDLWQHFQTIPIPHNNTTNFGLALALQGNTLVVASDRASFGGDKFGRIFIYGRSSSLGRWTMRQEIPSPVRVDNDHFGWGLDLDGDTLVVGALGAIKTFVFRRNGATWTLQKTLEPPRPEQRNATYGNFVAIQGDTIVIGEYNSSAPDEDEGVVHIHRRNEGGANQWGLVQRIFSPNFAPSELFGLGVALHGDTLAINSGDSRRLEIYHIDPDTGLATWESTLPKPLVPGVSEPQNSLWGRQIMIQGDLLLTSDAWDREALLNSGAAYLYRRDPGRRDRWTLLKKIIGEGVGEDSEFGRAIAMQDNEVFASGADDNTVEYPIGALFGFRYTRDVITVVSSAPATLADTGEAYRYEIEVEGAPDTAPVVSIGGDLPDWLTFENLGGGRALLSGTPPPAATGTWPLRLEVQEPWSLPSSQEFTLHVQEGNLAPVVLVDRLELAGDEDLPLEASLAQLFADGEDAVTDLEIEILPPVPDPLLESVNAPTGGTLLEIQPGEHENGMGSFTVRARDRGGLTSDVVVQVTIAPINDSPTAASIPDITSEPAAPPISRDLSASFDDPDLSREGDQLRYTMLNLSAPELFSFAAIDPDTGTINLEIAPYRDGEATMQIQVTDKEGETAEETLRVIVPAIAPPDLTLTSELRLNPQTGLLEQTLTATNTGPRAIGGFELSYANLPAGVEVRNATRQVEGSYRVEIGNPIAVGATVTLVVEVYVANRNSSFTPEPTVATILPITPSTTTGEGIAVTRIVHQDDGSLLIEFASEPGRSYEIQYSEDSQVWKVSPVRIVAGGSRVQWIDNGPPRTDSAPSTKAMRLYRVVALPPTP